MTPRGYVACVVSGMMLTGIALLALIMWLLVKLGAGS
jgi:hypothetical protein